MDWTGYESPEELRIELDRYILELQEDNLASLDKLNIHFLPACTFQEHSISNGWSDEYITLSEKFDALYKLMKKS